MPEKACGTEVAAAAQWQGQQHFLCPSASVDAAEPHLAEPKLLLASEGSIITIVVIDEALEHTSIRGEVVVVAVSRGIMNNKEKQLK